MNESFCRFLTSWLPPLKIVPICFGRCHSGVQTGTVVCLIASARMRRLGDVAGEPEDNKHWVKGEGFQPLSEADRRAIARDATKRHQTRTKASVVE